MRIFALLQRMGLLTSAAAHLLCRRGWRVKQEVRLLSFESWRLICDLQAMLTDKPACREPERLLTKLSSICRVPMLLRRQRRVAGADFMPLLCVRPACALCISRHQCNPQNPKISNARTQAHILAAEEPTASGRYIVSHRATSNPKEVGLWLQVGGPLKTLRLARNPVVCSELCDPGRTLRAHRLCGASSRTSAFKAHSLTRECGVGLGSAPQHLHNTRWPM